MTGDDLPTPIPSDDATHTHTTSEQAGDNLATARHVPRDIVRYNVNTLRREIESLRLHLTVVRARADEAIANVDSACMPTSVNTHVLGSAALEVESRAARVAMLVDTLSTLGATADDVHAAFTGQRVAS